MNRSDDWTHFDGRRYFCPGIESERSFRDLLRWRRERRAEPWPSWVENEPVEPMPSSIPIGGVAVSFVWHASFLLRSHSFALLTDPIWSRAAGPFGRWGPKAVRAPGLRFKQLPDALDVVFVSHNHYDHMDIPTLRRLDRTSVGRERIGRIVTPRGNASFLRRRGVRSAVTELDWWESIEFESARLTLVPSRHWSNRVFVRRNSALWGGLVIETAGKTIYFAGDSGPWPRLWTELSRRFPAFDLALLPIGAYEPRWFMEAAHMNPQDAVDAFVSLGARRALGMHYGTFQLTDETIDAPVRALEETRSARGVADRSFEAARFGATYLL